MIIIYIVDFDGVGTNKFKAFTDRSDAVEFAIWRSKKYYSDNALAGDFNIDLFNMCVFYQGYEFPDGKVMQIRDCELSLGINYHHSRGVN
jgi:hypothetical protein